MFNKRSMSIFSFLFKRKNKIPSLEIFPDAVIVFSKDFDLIDYNEYANKLFDLGNKKEDELKPENLFDCDFSILSKELLQENNICTLKIKNSDTFVEIKAAQVNEEHIYFSMRDVTQKHKTVTAFMLEYETSKKINRTKNNLLIKLSNELMAPLHSITGFSQAMLEGLSGKINEKQKKYLNVINKNAFDLLDFIDKLVEGAKLEANSYEFAPKVFDAIDAINNVTTEVIQQNPNAKIMCDYSTLERRAVYTDDVVLKKIIKYLIDNITKSVDYSVISIMAENPDLEYVKEQGLEVSESTDTKDFIHIEINSNVDNIKAPSELSVFEIYPQLEINAKREVINNIPLYNASLFSKYLKIKLTQKSGEKAGFDIIFNSEKP